MTATATRATCASFSFRSRAAEKRKSPQNKAFYGQRTTYSGKAHCIKDRVLLEPCCGSGHILVYVFDLLYAMYEERGYQKRDIPTLILTKNLTGLDVDKRAVQLASFSLVMKARSVNNRFFDEKYYVTPHVYELQDSKMLKNMGYRKHVKDLNLLNDTEIKLIDYLVDTFIEGKTIGSLLKVKPIDFACLDGALDKIHKQAVPSLFNTDFLSYGVKRLKELATLAKVLSAKYDVMITNPPYRPISSMEAAVNDYAATFYPNSKADMYAMFMETNYVDKNGFLSMVNMQNWMSNATYERLRERIVETDSIETMIHMGKRGFDAISGDVVQTVSFVFRNTSKVNKRGTYYDLTEGQSEAEKEQQFLHGNSRYITKQENFLRIPGTQLTAYWVSDNMVNCFRDPIIGKKFTTREGMATAGNDTFLRYWYELNYHRITFGCPDNEHAKKMHVKWVPYNKGGASRGWYGNNDYVVNWENDGYEIKHNFDPETGRLRSHNYNGEFGFKEGLTWSAISSGALAVRYCEAGYLFDSKGAKGFNPDHNILFRTLGLLNSKVSTRFLKFISPTVDYKVGDIASIPDCIKKENEPQILKFVDSSVDISKVDWDSFETSWGFSRHPLLQGESLIKEAYSKWSAECQNRFDQLKTNEEELNCIFIGIYGLQDELTPEVEIEDVTVRLADKARDIRSLISYLIGIVMGRYSLDVDGLAYAGGDWVASNYSTYQPDDDGIVPIYTKLGMDDGLTTKLIDLIKLIYGEDSYRQNIDFIAEALGKNNNESSEETLNRYLNDGFYADHLKIYQKRPIYWMFSSGKKAGFKCLIYMHRYNEDTLARINAKYYLPESTRKKNELDELNGQITKAEGRDKTRLEKERQNLAAAYNEAIEYGQVLDHVANQYIKIDLDDGVNVNYDKFQGVQLVTDSGTKVKKDLLVPLK